MARRPVGHFPDGCQKTASWRGRGSLGRAQLVHQANFLTYMMYLSVFLSRSCIIQSLIHCAWDDPQETASTSDQGMNTFYIKLRLEPIRTLFFFHVYGSMPLKYRVVNLTVVNNKSKANKKVCKCGDKAEQV